MAAGYIILAVTKPQHWAEKMWSTFIKGNRCDKIECVQ